MNKTMKTVGWAMLAWLPTMAWAGEVETQTGMDLVSGYIWRGQELGTFSIQPSLSVGYKGLSLSGWGSVGVNGTDTKEFDLTLGYSAAGWSISVTDYWFSRGTNNYSGLDVAPSYFTYREDKTAHVFEAQVGYDFGVAALNWYTNFAGNDGLNKDGKRAYSSYIAATAPFRLGGLDWKVGLGAVPWATSFYANADGFALTEVSIGASKALKVSNDYSIPLFTKAIWNPSSEGAWLVVGLSF